jgi:hypothetical protein
MEFLFEVLDILEIVVMFAQPCMYTKKTKQNKTEFYTFKMGNFILCELYLNFLSLLNIRGNY